MTVEVARDGYIYRQRYEEGKTVTKLEIVGKSDYTGTKTNFKPDPLILKKLSLTLKA